MSTPPSREVERLAAKTIQVLRTRGWHQGNLVDATTGAVCLSGALRVAAFGAVMSHIVTDPRHPYAVLRGAILDRLEIRGGTACISDWNDDVAETPEDVYLLIKEAVHS